MHQRLPSTTGPVSGGDQWNSSIGALLPDLSSHFQRLGYLVKSA